MIRKKIARLAEEKFHVPVLTVPCYGFLDGTQYYEGFYHAAAALIERFMQPCPKQEDAVALIGDISSRNMQEIQHYMDYFGLVLKWRFPCGASLAQIKSLPSASLLIDAAGKAMQSSHAERIAVRLSNAFSIPAFHHQSPVGLTKMVDWLTSLGDFLAKPREALLAVESERKRFHLEGEYAAATLRGCQTVVCIGRPAEYFDPSWLAELLSCGKIRCRAVVLLDTLSAEEKEKIKDGLKQQDVFAVIADTSFDDFSGVDFILTTHEILDISLKQWIMPIFPPFGVSGMIEMMRQLQYLHRRGEGGRRVYGSF